MGTLACSSIQRSPQTIGLRRRAGMTLVETMISLALLVISGVTGVYSLMLLNRYAMTERNLSTAKGLCQERIEQVQTLLYTPPATLPVVTGQDGNAYSLLGISTNYTTAGVYTGAESYVEPVTIYSPQDSSAPAITGTRTISIAPAAMADTSGAGIALPMVHFTVTVAYTFNGVSKTYSMYTMRASN